MGPSDAEITGKKKLQWGRTQGTRTSCSQPSTHRHRCISLVKKVDELSGGHYCYNQLCVGTRSLENSAQTVCSKCTRNGGVIANTATFWSLAQMHWKSSSWTSWTFHKYHPLGFSASILNTLITSGLPDQKYLCV